MKRYRVLGFDIDSTAHFIDLNDPTTWGDVVERFGIENAQQKAKNLKDLGNAPFSILAFHNKFLRQVRDAFTQGAYYPALTGACALGERILNQLIIKLRDYYRTKPEYKLVYDKPQFDDGDKSIDTLASWGILLPEVVELCDKLKIIRHRKAIHFNPETDTHAREYALDAVTLLSEIIQKQFSAFGNEPWFIANIPGCSFIKKSYEENPFVAAIYLPNCVYVGPYHDLEYKLIQGLHGFIPKDDHAYSNDEITDDEYARLYKTSHGQ